jgi:hypothetical protein
MLPVPTTAQLAEFTGRPEASFGPFAITALTQATLMLQMLTKLDAMPDDPDRARLAVYAIAEMADRILLEQPYSSVKSSPFQTETIGSYSYAKVTPTSKTAQQGSRTGLFWWDIAVDELTVAGQTLTAHGSIKNHIDGVVRLADGTSMVMEEYEQHQKVVDRPPYIRIS